MGLVIEKKRHITSGTKEWADHNVNCIKGCTNNCRYCYAKIIAKRFGRCTEITWKEIKINQKIINKKFGKYDGRVMFPSSHDIPDIPEAKKACFSVIKSLLEAGNDILITTKPRLRIIQGLVQDFQIYKPQIQFRFTITSIDNKLLSFWEPGAPTVEERLDCLKYAYNNSFKTSVSIEPFLDYDPIKLIELVLPFVTESIWIGPMNYIPKNGIPNEDRPKYEEIRSRYELNHLKNIFESLKDYPTIRFKDSMAIRLGLSEATKRGLRLLLTTPPGNKMGVRSFLKYPNS
jgi:DNA repair photolyase